MTDGTGGTGAPGFRAAVLAGDGVVARFPGLVCVARCPHPEPLARLLDLCATATGDEPGRVLARRLATWLGAADGPPAELVFGTLAAAGASRAVFLSGPVQAVVGDLHLSGGDAAVWLDRLVPAGTGGARLVLPGVAPGPPPALLDLREGVVAGAGVELVAVRRAPTGPRPAESGPAHPLPPTPVPPAPVPVDRTPPVVGPTDPPTPVPPGRPPGDPATLAEMEPVRPPGAPADGVGTDRTEVTVLPPARDGQAPVPAGSTAGAPAARDSSAQDAPAQDPSAQDPTAHDPSAQDPSAQDPSAQDPSAQDPAGHRPTAQDRTVEDPAAQDRTAQDPTTQDPTAQDPTAQDPTAQDPTAQDRSGGTRRDDTGPGDGPPDATGTAPIERARPALRPPQRAEAVLGVPPGGPPRPPLEPGDPVATGGRSVVPGAAPGPGAGEVRGLLCSRGHLNDPRSASCTLCGARMNERTGVLVVGRRPPLGLLLFDDGATYTVDAEYLVGRMPEPDERVRAGALRAIVVEDRSGAVSRVHAEVRLDGWDVLLVDSGSRNGTHVAGPGEPAWTALPPRHTHRLVPGTRVRMGARTFVFESPAGVRQATPAPAPHR